MRLEHKQADAPRNVVIVDGATQQRIPMVQRIDTDTGEYEALLPSPDGRNAVVDVTTKQLVRIQGKLKGPVKFVPIDNAAPFGYQPPKPVETTIIPLTADVKLAGQQQYERVFKNVWQYRGEHGRRLHDRWCEYVEKSDFLDSFLLKRHSTPTS